MRLRILTILTIVCALVVILGYKAFGWQEVQKQVYLGGVTFVPASVNTGQQSVLKVSVATSPSVPAYGADVSSPIKAVVSIRESQNFGGVSYSVSPSSQVAVIPLAGGGRASIGEFTFSVSTQNTGRGNVVYTVNLDRLDNNVGASIVAPTTLTATLSVGVPPPTPTPTPTPQTADGDGGCIPQTCVSGGNIQGYWDAENCLCEYSPVLIDVAGDGFELTNTQNGVNFDLDADGNIKEKLSWTAAGSDDAFLFIDRNENGVVDNGIELFGSFTPQPASDNPNGFLALRVFDEVRRGGNEDGVIDKWDAAFSELRLWQDTNHNGVSESRELRGLTEFGIYSISLDYKESKRRDRYGNLFRYRTKLYGEKGRDLGRWACDVFLVPKP